MDGWPGLVLAAAVLAVLLSAAEWIDPEDRGGLRPRRHSERRREPVAWFVLYLTYAPAVAIATTMIAAALAAHGPARPFVAALPIGAQIAGAVLVADLVAYALHRSMHAVPVLWRVHRVHHRGTEVWWWSTFRFHPVDGALMHALPLLVAAACGFGPGALAGYVGLVFVVTAFAHADVWMPGGWARYVVVLPAFHRTHHEVGHDDRNYGLAFSFWDACFASASHARPTERRFGVRDQWSSASPTASDARLAQQLTASAANGSARRRRQTSAASR